MLWASIDVFGCICWNVRTGHFIPVIQKTSPFVTTNIKAESRAQGTLVALSQLKLLMLEVVRYYWNCFESGAIYKKSRPKDQVTLS